MPKLSGVVSDVTGRRIDHAIVDAFAGTDVPPTTQSKGQSTTDDEGRYSIDLLDARNVYTVRVTLNAEVWFSAPIRIAARNKQLDITLTTTTTVTTTTTSTSTSTTSTGTTTMGTTVTTDTTTTTGTTTTVAPPGGSSDF